VWSVAFSPDGSRIVTGSSDQTARIWDAASAKEIAVLRGHEWTVFSAAFSPDGSRIVTASGDKTARIWDVPPRPLLECAPPISPRATNERTD
jgi:WD40 repeat protein